MSTRKPRVLQLRAGSPTWQDQVVKVVERANREAATFGETRAYLAFEIFLAGLVDVDGLEWLWEKEDQRLSGRAQQKK